MEYITSMEGADPIGPLVEQLVTNWETDHARRHLLLLGAHLVGSLAEAEKASNSLRRWCSAVFLRERVAIYLDLMEELLAQVRGTSQPVLVGLKGVQRHETVHVFREFWLKHTALRQAVEAAREAAEETLGWYDRQLVCNWVLRAAQSEELRQLLPKGIGVQEVIRQSKLVENFAYGRAGSLYHGKFEPALRAVCEVDVSRGEEEEKAAFAWTPHEVQLLGLSRMGHDVKDRLEVCREEKIKAFTPPPLQTTTPSGIVVIGKPKR